MKAGLLMLCGVGLLAGCSRSGKSVAGGPPAVPVQATAALQQDVPRRIESIGSVQALRSVAIKAQVDGIIASIHFKEGDEVKAGDLLVTLDRRPFENSLRIARADLANVKAEAEQAAADAERYRRLDQEAAISKEQLTQLLTKADTSRAVVQAKEAAVANAELQYSYSEIRAPVGGRTGQLLLHEGSLVKANDVNQSILSINQIAPISVAYSVPEDMLPEVRAALAQNEAKVTVSDRTGGKPRGDGRLQFIDNAVDTTTGTIVLKALFENSDHTLWPGQFVRVLTDVGIDHDAVVVPSSAVQTGQSSSQVFVIKSDKSVELRPVVVARTLGDMSVIKSGVRAGETVVTDGQLRLVPGAKVEIKTLASASAAAGNDAAGSTQRAP